MGGRIGTVRILLDTHAFLWLPAGNPRLVETARRAIADDDNDVLISAASAWEIATKYRLGKLPEADALADDIRGSIADQGSTNWPSALPMPNAPGGLPARNAIPSTACLSPRPWPAIW